MLGQHLRARRQPVDQERAQNQRHGGAARHAEGDGRHQRAAFLGVVRALGRDDPAHVALAERGGRILLAPQRMAVGDPVDHRRADPRHRAEAGPDGRAAKQQEPVAEDVPDARDLAHFGLDLALRGDPLPGDRHVGDFRNRKQAEGERHHRQPVPEVERIEGPAERPGLRIVARGRHHQPDTGRGQALERRAAAQHRDQGEPEDAERQEFRRADMEHHRAQDRYADREQERAVDAADHRGRECRSEGASRLALPGHRVAVENRRRRSHGPRHPEQHRRYGVRGHHHRLQAHQEGERGIGVHVESERQQQGQADQPAQPRDDAEDQPDQHAEREKADPLRIGHDRRGLDGHAEHVGFHELPCLRLPLRYFAAS